MAHHSRRFRVVFNEYLDGRSKEYWTIEDDAFKGFFNYIVQAMQFSYDAVVKKEISGLLPNGTWTGSIGLLNRSEVDLASILLVVTEERWDAVSYNYPFIVDEMTFVAKKPEYSPEIMALFRPLSPTVWLSLLVSIFLLALVCYLALMRSPCSLVDVLFDLIAISLGQEGEIAPQRTGELLLLFSWNVGMTLLGLVFKSVLLSFLPLPPLSGVRTVPELAAAIRAGQYNALPYRKNYVARYLYESPNEDVRLIGENLLRNSVGSVDDLLHKSSRNVVIVIPTSHASFAEGRLYVSKDSMGSLLVGTAVSKGFCCKDEMDELLHRFMAAGIHDRINRLRDFRQAFEQFSGLPEDDRVWKITTMNISGAFALLVAGHSLSVCVLVLERWIKNPSTSRNKAEYEFHPDRFRNLTLIYFFSLLFILLVFS